MSDAPAEPLEGAEGLEAAEEKQPLSLEIKIDESGACKRHVTVTISREDIDRYLEEAVDELVPKAEVPGFRPGRAPRKLVAARFKQQVQDQVKGGLLMDSMDQVSEEADFSAISEPDFNYNAVTLPDEGPMTFEFDIEVRPDFDVPDWKGLQLERPVREVDEDAIDEHLKYVLQQYGKSIKAETAEPDDALTVDIEFHKDGKLISRVEEEEVKLRPTLSFGNAELTGFDQLAAGAKPGSQLTATVTLSEEDSDESLRGAEVEARIKVREIERRELPSLTHQFLDQIGGFEDEDELRDTVRKELERQLAYHQQRRVREQITSQLVEGADWELPQDLLRRQAGRELERAVMELEASGFSMEQINQHANQLRQNSLNSTAAALKEHFILERIAEDLEIDADPMDFDTEIQMIAMQRNEPARRVRARMEKRGQLDSLRNQIIERKVIQAIMDEARFADIPFEEQPRDTYAIGHVIGHKTEIAKAEHGEEESLRQPADYT